MIPCKRISKEVEISPNIALDIEKISAIYAFLLTLLSLFIKSSFMPTSITKRDLCVI
jgi:hypothetical protein